MGVSTTVSGWLAAVIVGWLWLEARDDLAAERETCNREKVEAVAEAERVTRETIAGAHERELRAAAARTAREREARLRAEHARAEADQRPVEVREIIRRVRDANACLDVDLPVDLVRGLQ